MKLKGFLDTDNRTKENSDYIDQTTQQHEKNDYYEDSKPSYKNEKEQNFNKNKFKYSNYHNKKNGPPSYGWKSEDHPNLPCSKNDDYFDYNSAYNEEEAVWDDYDNIHEALDLDEDDIVGDFTNSQQITTDYSNNKTSYNQKNVYKGIKNLFLEKPLRKKNNFWEGENRDYNNNINLNMNNVTPTVEKNNSAKTDNKKVIFLVL